MTNNEELVEEARHLANLRSQFDVIEREIFLVENAILSAMEQAGASVKRVGAYRIIINQGYKYDASRLAPLREITDPQDLEGIYIPEHEETVRKPEKWNMVKGKKLAKLGAEHAAIIADARIPQRPKVVIVEELIEEAT